MLVYLSAPYSEIEDKARLMQLVMRVSGEYMVRNPGAHVVSPLFNHFSLPLVPELGSGYDFWKEYSMDLLRRCDRILLLKYPGWEYSTGVQDELEVGRRLNLFTVAVDVQMAGSNDETA